jgi:hypothetical protein
MQGSGVRIRQAVPGEWERVREIRLRSLVDSPDAGSRRVGGLTYDAPRP